MWVYVLIVIREKSFHQHGRFLSVFLVIRGLTVFVSEHNSPSWLVSLVVKRFPHRKLVRLVMPPGSLGLGAGFFQEDQPFAVLLRRCLGQRSAVRLWRRNFWLLSSRLRDDISLSMADLSRLTAITNRLEWFKESHISQSTEAPTTHAHHDFSLWHWRVICPWSCLIEHNRAIYQPQR